MREWFKARNVWGGAFSALTDEEAGRLAKAIWAYTMTGEIKELDGAEKGIFAMILMTLGQDEEHDAEVSKKRSQATAGIRKQKISDDDNCDQQWSDDVNCNQMISNDIKSNQLISNDDNKNKNKSKNKNKEQDKENKFTPPTTDEVADYCKTRGNGIDAEYFIAYYANRDWKLSNGRKMKDWKLAIVTWEKNNFSSKPKVIQPKAVTAQSYTQRDYAGEQGDAMRRMLEGVRA